MTDKTVMRFFTMAEVAAQAHQSERTVARAVATGRLRSMRIENRVRIGETDADNYLNGCRRLALYGPDSNERRRIAEERAAAAQDDAADAGEAPALAEPVGESFAEGWSANVLGGLRLAYGACVAPLVKDPLSGVMMTHQEYLRLRAENRAFEARVEGEIARQGEMAAAGARRGDERSAEPAATVKDSTNAE